MMAVEVTTEPVFSRQAQSALRACAQERHRVAELRRDARRRALSDDQADARSRRTLHIVTNWFEELKRPHTAHALICIRSTGFSPTAGASGRHSLVL